MVKVGSEVVVDILGFVVEFLLVFLSSHGGPSLTDDSFSNWDVSKVSGSGPVHTEVWYWIVLWPHTWFIRLWEEILSASRWIADWIRLDLDSGVHTWVMLSIKLNPLVSWNFPWSIKIVGNFWDLVSFLNLGKILLCLSDILIELKVFGSQNTLFFSFWSGHFMVQSLFSKSKTVFKSFNFSILTEVLSLKSFWVLEEVLWSN